MEGALRGIMAVGPYTPVKWNNCMSQHSLLKNNSSIDHRWQESTIKFKKST